MKINQMMQDMYQLGLEKAKRKIESIAGDDESSFSV